MHVEFQRSDDVAYFNRMTNDPDISPFIRDDATPGELDFSQVDMSTADFLKVLVDGREAGFAILINVDGDLELHSGLLPEFRGRTAVVVGRELVKWVFWHTKVRRLTTWAWDTAKNVLFVAKAIGFKESARVDWPNTVNGKPVKQVHLEIDLSNLKFA